MNNNNISRESGDQNENKTKKKTKSSTMSYVMPAIPRE